MKFFFSFIKLFEFNLFVFFKLCDYGIKVGKRKFNMGRNKKKILVMLLFCNVFFYLIIEESFCYCDCKY